MFMEATTKKKIPPITQIKLFEIVRNLLISMTYFFLFSMSK